MAPRYNLIIVQDAVDQPSSPTMSTKVHDRASKIMKGEKRRVHFRSPSSRRDDFISEDIFWVPSLADMTLEEKESVWLTRRDLQQMDEMLRVDLMRSSLRHHKTDLGNDNPLRGLEWKTLDGIHQRNRHWKQGVSAVLEEQRRQRSSNGGFDDLDMSLIAARYQLAIGSASHDRARGVAIQDEKTASQIILEDGASS